MLKFTRGFTLVELITVIILVGIISISVSSRFFDQNIATVQSSRDDVIAALFFAQQTAMARSGIAVSISANSVNVTENGTSIVIHSGAYPLTLPSGVTATPASFNYDKLGKTSPGTITLNKDGISATITVEASGYAHY